MPSLNRVELMGNLTRDIELKYLQSGTAVCEMGVAVNEGHKDNNGQWVDDVLYVDVTCWGRTAENAAKYLHKGSPVHIEGKLKLDRWEKNGQKFSRLKVTGLRVQFLGVKPGARSEPDPAPAPPQDADPPDLKPDDGVPF